MGDLYEDLDSLSEDDLLAVDDISDDVNVQTVLIFAVGDNNYSIDSSSVKEIVRNVQVFSMPFLPKYIKGVLNYYSKPYAVVDILNFLDGKFLDGANIFLVLNDENNISLQITDVREFHEIKNMQDFSNSEKANFFKGAIEFGNSTVPVLNIENIIQKIRSDIE